MTCRGLRSHITDSRFFRHGYTTDEARTLFCDYRRLQRWLDVEVALALTQAELGVIPQSAAKSLAATARLSQFDAVLIQSQLKLTGHSLMPLLTAWQQVSDPEAGQYIHFGATTQDIQDTAQSLELKDATSIIGRDLQIIIKRLSVLAGEYRQVVTVGRTHGRHALPTTLGLKFSVWLDEMLRNADRLAECRKRLLVCQMFGGVGTMAAFAGRGLEILDGVAARLGLNRPLTAWHAARDRVAEYLAMTAIMSGTLAKIANEICQLSRDEINELEEPFHSGKVGSSTMPHKRNPELCEQVVVLSRLIKSNSGLGMEGMISEHERDYRAVRLEWVSVVDSTMYLCGALRLMKDILAGFTINKEGVAGNVEKSAEMISSEALMFLLGKKIGKQQAHKVLYETAMEADAIGSAIIDHLLMHAEIKGKFSRSELAGAINPANNIGSAIQLTDAVIQAADRWLAEQDDDESVAGCALCADDNDQLSERDI